MAVSSHLNNLCPTEKNINEKSPNGKIIRYKIEDQLNLPMLTDLARQAHIFPNIKHSLISIKELYDAGCTVTFKIKDVTAV